MESDDLRAEEVLAGCNVGNGDGVLAPVLDQGVNGPGAIGVAILGNLDPTVASSALLSRGHVDHDGTFVGGSDDVVRIAAGVVVPLEGDLVTGLDLKGLSGSLVVNVAGHVLGGDIGDGAVAGGRTDVAALAVTFTLVDIVDPDGVDGGVGADELSSRCQSEHTKGRGLHFDKECKASTWTVEKNVKSERK